MNEEKAMSNKLLEEWCETQEKHLLDIKERLDAGSKDITVQDDTKGKKFDTGKPRYSLIPDMVLLEVVKVLTYGAAKYDEDQSDPNWRHVPDARNRYYDATMRHVEDWKHNDSHHDPETGFHPLAHAIADLMFLMQIDLENSVEQGDAQCSVDEFEQVIADDIQKKVGENIGKSDPVYDMTNALAEGVCNVVNDEEDAADRILVQERADDKEIEVDIFDDDDEPQQAPLGLDTADKIFEWIGDSTLPKLSHEQIGILLDDYARRINEYIDKPRDQIILMADKYFKSILEHLKN